jgi:hypothetical protein
MKTQLVRRQSEHRTALALFHLAGGGFRFPSGGKGILDAAGSAGQDL